MFRNTVECDIVSMRVSEIIVPTGNSLTFPSTRRVICFPQDTPHDFSIVGWRHPIPKLPRASVVAKSETLEGRSTPVKYVVGQCAG